jgi:hypothetical protein
VGYVGGARNRESAWCSMEASKHMPNDTNEPPGGTNYENSETTLEYSHMFGTSYSTPIKSVRKLENFILIGTQSWTPKLGYCKPAQKALLLKGHRWVALFLR